MKQKLVKGAFYVTMASLLVKILSIVYKIPYQNYTGDKGFYIYQQLYPLYALISAFGSYAFPLAVSEALIKTKEKAKALSSPLIVALGCFFILSIMIIGFHPLFAVLMGDKQLSLLFVPLAVTLLLSPFVSVIRGYLYSDENTVGKVGLSATFEQLFRIVWIILILFLYARNQISNLYHVALYSLSGYVIGAITGIVVVGRCFDFKLIRISEVDFHLGGKIFKRGLFLLISASLLLFLQMIDSFTIVKSLTNKYHLDEAMVIKGIYDRALPLIQTGGFFVFPVITSFLPHIKTKAELNKLLVFIVSLALPATIGLIRVMSDLNILLFKDNQLTEVLQINALTVFLYALILTYAAVNKDNIKLLITVGIGLLIKLSGNIVLVSRFGITGGAYSTIIALLVMLVILLVINRKAFSVSFKLLGEVVIANIVMSLAIMIPQTLTLTLLTGVFVYGVMCYLLGLVKYFRENTDY